MPFETAMPQWEEGRRRLERAPVDQRRELERVTERIVGELRKRLGGPFSTEELVDLYDRGTGWCTDVAVAVSPDNPEAWDTRTVADAAFHRYLREASDFAGGVRRTTDPEAE